MRKTRMRSLYVHANRKHIRQVANDEYKCEKGSEATQQTTSQKKKDRTWANTKSNNVKHCVLLPATAEKRKSRSAG